MAEFRIIPREEWGAQFNDGFYDRPVGSLERWLHHSVTIAPDLVQPFDDDYAAIRELDRIGQTRFKGGISYTFAITPAALIFEGHSIGRVGSHTKNHNTKGVGIVFVGNYETATPTPQMLEALTWLLHHGVAQGWWKSPTLSGGHRDTKATACPGARAYALIDEVNRGDYLTGTPVNNPIPTPPPAPTDQRKYKMHRLDLSNAHNVPVRDIHVDNLQGLLLAAGYGPAGLVDPRTGRPDGVAGAKTREYVGDWQIKKNVGDGRGGADYIVGDGSWVSLIEY